MNQFKSVRESWSARRLCRRQVLRRVAVVLLTAVAGTVARGAGTNEAPSAMIVASAERTEELKKMSLESLMNIEVATVSRTESTVGESPAAIFVITQEMIRRSGATAIPELFRMVPGMDVQRIDNNKWAVSSRGLIDRFDGKLLVQVDGRTVYNPLFSGVYWDSVQYPLEIIDRIEVIRGPGASVWGANAVNGVINIITKSAKDTQGSMVSGGGGTGGTGFGEFIFGEKINDELYWRTYGQGFTRDGTFSNSGIPNDGWWGSSGGARVDWQASERDAVTVDFQYVHTVSGDKDLRPMPTAPFVFTNLQNEVTNAGDIRARWNHQFDKESSWTLQAYYDIFDRELENLLVHLRWQTFDVDFQQQFPLNDRMKFMYGLGYRCIISYAGPSEINNGFTTSFTPSNFNQQIVSCFLQNQIAIVPDKLALTLGSKFEHNDFTGFEEQPTARLLWTPTPRQTAWAAFSRAVRTPNVGENSAQTTLLPAFPPSLGGAPLFPRLKPNSNFQSETEMAYEIGYRMQATDKLSVDVTTFYNDYGDIRANVPLAATTKGAPDGTYILPLPPENLVNGETYGIEWFANYQLTDWWKLYAAYTFLEIHMRYNNNGITAGQKGSLNTAVAGYDGKSPEQQVYLQSSWNLPYNIEVDLIGRYVDSVTGFNPSHVAGLPNTISSYEELDARLAWRPRKNLEFEVVGQNLINTHHAESGSSPSVKTPVVEFDRSVYGKVTWWF